MSYKIDFGQDIVLSFKNKDEVINYLLAQVNADGAIYVKLSYPDGSYYEYQGEDEY